MLTMYNLYMMMMMMYKVLGVLGLRSTDIQYFNKDGIGTRMQYNTAASKEKCSQYRRR